MYILAPNAFAAALPVLLLLACPVSMLIMMFSMRGMGGGHTSQATSHAQSVPSSMAASDARKQQLLGLSEQQSALARQIDDLERSDAPAESANAASPVGRSR